MKIDVVVSSTQGKDMLKNNDVEEFPRKNMAQ
jgi:hypothetical protein